MSPHMHFCDGYSRKHCMKWLAGASCSEPVARARHQSHVGGWLRVLRSPLSEFKVYARWHDAAGCMRSRLQVYPSSYARASCSLGDPVVPVKTASPCQVMGMRMFDLWYPTFCASSSIPSRCAFHLYGGMKKQKILLIAAEPTCC